MTITVRHLISRFTRLAATFLLPVLLFAQHSDWRTFYEKNDFLRTPRYAETISFCKRLDQASPLVVFTSFGISPQGRQLPLLIVSSDRVFSPEAARQTRKPVVLIQSGIHAGEIDGKDASLMLVRDMVIMKKHAELLDNAVILFIPIFNVDGHERFGPYNRVNQNGPEEMGWRVTAQNLNLNRDYMKADAPETRAWLALFQAWRPDFVVDCHVTDGIDFQYDVTFAMETWPNADRELSQWYEQRFIPAMIADVERAGHGIAPYVVPREDNDLSKGLVFSASGPRLSTGYCAKQNRPALLVETHMLKPYKTRVSSTYEILVSSLRFVNANAQTLRSVVRDADRRTAALGQTNPPSWLPLRFELTSQSRLVPFKGVASSRTKSAISGTERLVYSTVPQDTVIPYFDSFRVTDSVTVPRAYAIPPEWSHLRPLLKLHGIDARILTTARTVNAETYRLKEPKWQEQPYEGHHPVRFRIERQSERRTLPAGTMFIPTNQRSAAVMVHLLEPSAPDAFVAWGFFDAIFEQKEYAEGYVLEQMAGEMMEKDSILAQDFRNRIEADTAFAKNAYARLNYFYQRSPYWDPSIGRYPVIRVMK